MEQGMRLFDGRFFQCGERSVCYDCYLRDVATWLSNGAQAPKEAPCELKPHGGHGDIQA